MIQKYLFPKMRHYVGFLQIRSHIMATNISMEVHHELESHTFSHVESGIFKSLRILIKS